METVKRVADRYSFCFLLCDGYSRLSLTMMLEMLQEANRILGSDKYQVTIVSDNAWGVPGMLDVMPLAQLSDQAEFDVVAVIGGANLSVGCSIEAEICLRRQQRRGCCLIAVESGVRVLAQAGMLKGRSVSCFVGHLKYLSDLYPDVSFNTNIFSNSGGVFSCAGGVSTADMLFELIERFTPSIYEELCVRMALDRPRSGTVQQRNMVHRRYSGLGQSLIDAIELMEANIDEVLSIDEVATHSGVSKRQLERLFKRHLNLSPSQFYLQLRLKRARNRILNTTNPVLDVAFSCGFVAPTHFSRAYKAYFGVSPKKDRQLLMTVC